MTNINKQTKKKGIQQLPTMILSAAANVTMGDHKMKERSKQNNPFDASSRRSVVARRGGGTGKTSGESCKESGG